MTQAAIASILLLHVFVTSGRCSEYMLDQFHGPFLSPTSFGQRQDLLTYVEGLLQSQLPSDDETADTESESSTNGYSSSTVPSEPEVDTTVNDVNQLSKYAFSKRQSSLLLSKRIHTCAFMSRLGLPIGLCFAGTTHTRRPSVASRPPPRPSKPKTNVYAILEKHWPVHSMLGGGVGRR